MPKTQLNKYVVFHYISFLRFYNSAIQKMNTDHDFSYFTLALSHLKTLHAFSCAQDEIIRNQFNVIRIVDFLVQQIMFESTLTKEEAAELEKKYGDKESSVQQK